MGQIQATAKFTSIPSDNLDRFKKVAGDCLEIVKERDTGTLQYDWFLSADGTQCVVRETYASSDDVMNHMGNLGEVLGELLELGGRPEIEICGDLSDELADALAPFGPAVYSFFQGT